MDKETLQLARDIADDFEGLSLDAYHDPVGLPTIGYGHLLSREPLAALTKWPSISLAKAEELLEQDMLKAAMSVSRLIKVPLSIEQAAALIDFTFNCGGGNLQVSTLRRVVNREEHADVPAQFVRWVYARGRKLPGLVRRRRHEAELYMIGT